WIEFARTFRRPFRFFRIALFLVDARQSHEVPRFLRVLRDRGLVLVDSLVPGSERTTDLGEQAVRIRDLWVESQRLLNGCRSTSEIILPEIRYAQQELQICVTRILGHRRDNAPDGIRHSSKTGLNIREHAECSNGGRITIQRRAKLGLRLCSISFRQPGLRSG